MYTLFVGLDCFSRISVRLGVVASLNTFQFTLAFSREKFLPRKFSSFCLTYFKSARDKILKTDREENLCLWIEPAKFNPKKKFFARWKKDKITALKSRKILKFQPEEKFNPWKNLTTCARKVGTAENARNLNLCPRKNSTRKKSDNMRVKSRNCLRTS